MTSYIATLKSPCANCPRIAEEKPCQIIGPNGNQCDCPLPAQYADRLESPTAAPHERFQARHTVDSQTQSHGSSYNTENKIVADRLAREHGCKDRDDYIRRHCTTTSIGTMAQEIKTSYHNVYFCLKRMGLLAETTKTRKWGL